MTRPLTASNSTEQMVARLEAELQGYKAELADREAALENEKAWYLGFNNEIAAREERKRNSSNKHEKDEQDRLIAICKQRMDELQAKRFPDEAAIYQLKWVVIPNRVTSIERLRPRGQPPYWR
jgi:predicted  nucleic acid-binding Zn-ribbon protein